MPELDINADIAGVFDEVRKLIATDSPVLYLLGPSSEGGSGYTLLATVRRGWTFQDGAAGSQSAGFRTQPTRVNVVEGVDPEALASKLDLVRFLAFTPAGATGPQVYASPNEEITRPLSGMLKAWGFTAYGLDEPYPVAAGDSVNELALELAWEF